MAKFLATVGLLLSPLAAALSQSAGLGIYFENGDQDTALLKLDYATYRATYNSTYDVSLTYCSFCGITLTQGLPYVGIYLQEHSLRSTTSWELEMGKTGRSFEDYRSAGW
jgi:hypothetical protein